MRVEQRIGLGLMLVSVTASAAWIGMVIGKRSTAQAIRREVTPSEWSAMLSGGTVVRGRAGPTIVVFSDYLCPACKALDEQLRTIAAEAQFVEIVRHFPIINDSVSSMAAQAVECAASTGQATLVHAALFAAAPTLAAGGLDKILSEAMPVSSMVVVKRCLSQGATKAVVDRDLAMARELRLGGTPALILAGRIRYGAQNAESLLAQIRRAAGSVDSP